MKHFLGGTIGAVTGATLFSVVWFFASSDGFGFAIGFLVIVPLGSIGGGGFRHLVCRPV